MIRKEIEDHIEDRTNNYIEFGMSREDAQERAVAGMGDPLEVGSQMNKLHRPKVPYGMLLIAFALTVFGIIMQTIVFKSVGIDNEVVAGEYMGRSILYNIIGFGIMIAFLFFDYRLIGKYALEIYFVYLLGCIGCMIWQYWLGGRYPWVLGYYMTLLYGMVFTVFLYKYRQQKWKGILKLFGMSVLAMFLLLVTDLINLSAFMEVCVCILIIYTISVVKNIYQGKKLPLLLAAWVPAVVIPGVLFLDAIAWGNSMHLFATYQIERLRAVINPFLYGETRNYMIVQTRNAASTYTLFGNKEVVQNIGSYGYSDFMVSNIFSYFGILAGAAVLLLFVFFVCRAFHISVKQSNKLGLILGVACSSNLLIQVGVGIVTNFGYGTMMTYYMPFLSFGLGNAVLNAFMVGLLLCVYRNTDILSEFGEKKKTHAYRIKIVKEEV